MTLILLAIVVGFALPVQAGVNAQLFRVPLPAARVASQAPAWHWIGGILGAVYIAVAVVLAPRLGAATMIASVVAGQMLASLLLDHFGWVGFARQEATPARLLGAGLIILGVRLLQR